MASNLGTFMGNPITYHDCLSKPKIGSIIQDYNKLTLKIFNGTDWIKISTEDIDTMSDIQHRWQNQKQLSDSWLEEKYSDLKKIRESYEKEYNTLRDKYKVFEILSIRGESDV